MVDCTSAAAPEVLPQGAAEAFQDLLQFSKRVQNKENHVSEARVNILPDQSGPEADSVADISFSDDDSFLVECSQALDSLEANFGEKVGAVTVEQRMTPASTACTDIVEPFGRSDSFDDIMSQLDSEQLEMETTTVVEPKDVVKKEQAKPLQPLTAPPQMATGRSPGTSKTIKRFKSSDAGIPSKIWGSSIGGGSVFGPIRRVHSSPAIPAEPPKCTAAEIDRKRQEARKKRELSQITRKRV